jgi:hypothetical protein
VGEKLKSGEPLEPEEVEELAKTIAAPVPVIESRDEKGGI